MDFVSAGHWGHLALHPRQLLAECMRYGAHAATCSIELNVNHACVLSQLIAGTVERTLRLKNSSKLRHCAPAWN
eukprot:4195047-Amphidinium_carterae.1